MRKEGTSLLGGGGRSTPPPNRFLKNRALILTTTLIFSVAVALIIGLYILSRRAVSEEDPFARAKALLLEYPLIDGHNDVPWAYRLSFNDTVGPVDFNKAIAGWQTDIPKLKAGQVGAQFWSVYTPCSSQGKDAVRQTLEQIDVVYKLLRKYPETFAMAYTPQDILKNFANQRISSLIGIEGGHQIDASLGALRMMYNLGARYMTLTHNCNNEIGDSSRNGCSEDVDCRQGECINGSCTEPQTEGLTPFGVEVVREMNRLGMLVDISHVSPEAMRKVLAASRAPVIFSHSNAYALCNNNRNVPDDVLLKLRDNRGIVMVVFLNQFVSCTDAATLEQVIDHIDYIVKGKCPQWKPDCNPNGFPGIGPDFVGLGSDYDGGTDFPDGLKDVSGFVNLTAALFQRGYSDFDVKRIIGENLVRVFTEVMQEKDRLATDFPGEDVLWPGRLCRSNL